MGKRKFSKWCFFDKLRFHFDSHNSLSVNSPFQSSTEGPNQAPHHKSKSPIDGGVTFKAEVMVLSCEPFYGMDAGVVGC